MIEVEGLPEGWKAVAYRRPYPQEYILKSEGAMKVRIRGEQPWLIIEKIQPREITLVETDEFRQPRYGEYFRRGMVDSPIEVCLKMEYCAVKIWKIKEER